VSARLLCFVASLAVFALTFGCSSPHRDILAITHVTVIDMTGAPPRHDQTVLITKQKITALGPSSSVVIPRGSKIVDATGKFLIPGLADMHIHLTAASEPDGSRKFMIPLLLANGITSVRDMGGYLESLVPLRKEIDDGKRLGPSLVYAGPYLDGSLPSFQPSLVANDRAQAEQDVHDVVSHGVDFVKVQSLLNRDAYFAIAAAARHANITFVGHVPDRVTAAEAADAGQHSIEHLTNILRGCSRDEAALMREQFYQPKKKETPAQHHARVERWQAQVLKTFSPETCDALIAKFVQHDVWQTPTLGLLKNDAYPQLGSGSAADPRTKYIPVKTLELWQNTRSEQMRFVEQSESTLRAELFAKSAQLVAQMHKAGVKILAGTDSPAPYVFPGSGLHDELALLVDAGLTPLEALQAATRDAAEFLHRDDASGTIAPEKYADLVLLDADPLQDIRNTQKIRAVILRGKLLDRPALDALLESVRSFAASH
jgi:imidazolonepropionase-like amidohydrolase